MNLVEIFYAMDKEGGKTPDLKDAAAVKKYFQKVYPDLDFERVYSSDLKKMAKWYDILKANKVEIKLTPAEEPQEEEIVEDPPAKQEKTPAAKANKPKEEEAGAPAKKKPKTEAADAGVQEEKPKKTAAKKTTERKQPDAASGVESKNKKEAKAPAKKSAPKKK